MKSKTRVLSITCDMDHMLRDLTQSLTDRKESCIREYVSNAHDACIGLPNSRIDLEVDHQRLVIEDNGRGMTEEEIQKGFTNLAGHMEIKGTSGKRIGQFGIGVLSAFMIADYLVMETRSMNENRGWRVVWRNLDSCYSLEEIEKDKPGTRCELYLSDEAKLLINKNKVRSYVSHHLSMLPIPIFLNGEPQKVNHYYDFLDQLQPDEDGHLLDSIEALDLHQLSTEETCQTLYTFTSPTPNGNCRFFIGIPAVKQMRFANHKVVFFSKGVLVGNLEGAVFPNSLDFVNLVVDHPLVNLNLNREKLRRDEAVNSALKKVEEKIIDFLIKVADETPHVFNHLLSVYNDNFAVLIPSEPRIADLVRDHYQFRTTASKGYLWKNLVNSVKYSINGEQVIITLDRIAVPDEISASVMQKGYELVYKCEETEPFLEFFAKNHPIKLLDVEEIIPSMEALPTPYKRLQARLGAAFIGTGINGIEFLGSAGQNAPPATFRMKRYKANRRRDFLQKDANGSAKREDRLCVEGLLITMDHPLVRKLAENVSMLTETQINRAGEMLLFIATLNSPFPSLQHSFKSEIIGHLVEGFESELSEIPDPCYGDYGVCFVAFPYKEEFNVIFNGISSVLGNDPYCWKMIRGNEHVKDAEILSSIHHHVNRSQRFIADISGQNQNVLLELGMMLQKDPHSTLILCDKETAKKIPADLRGRIFIEYDSDLRRSGGYQKFADWFESQIVFFERFIALRRGGTDHDLS